MKKRRDEEDMNKMLGHRIGYPTRTKKSCMFKSRYQYNTAIPTTMVGYVVSP